MKRPGGSARKARRGAKVVAKHSDRIQPAAIATLLSELKDFSESK